MSLPTKVTTPGLQTRRIVLPLLANLNRVDDAGEDEQDDTPMHNQDQEEEPEEPESPEETEDPPLLSLRKKPPVGKMNVTTEPASSISTSQPLPSLAFSLSLQERLVHLQRVLIYEKARQPVFSPHNHCCKLQTPRSKKNKPRSTQDMLQRPSPCWRTCKPSFRRRLHLKNHYRLEFETKRRRRKSHSR
jgi:hypothetical protein